MSKIGQIIYNVEDYAGYGGLSSSSANNPLTSGYIVEKENESNEITSQKINIYENILEQCHISKILKLGIQAPPGTKFLLNSSEINTDINALTLIVGRTGIYELDLSGQGDGNNLTYLKFLRPQYFVLDEADSFKRSQEGITNMNKAKRKFDEEVNKLNSLYGSAATETDTNNEYWKDYDFLFQTYCDEYEGARALYLQGINGIYRKGSEGDLQNVIIDFYYEID